MTKDNRCKEYLGDAVYASWTGHDVVLTTEDGIRATNTIVLDPWVIAALENFLVKLNPGFAEEAEVDDEKAQ